MAFEGDLLIKHRLNVCMNDINGFDRFTEGNYNLIYWMSIFYHNYPDFSTIFSTWPITIFTALVDLKTEIEDFDREMF